MRRPGLILILPIILLGTIGAAVAVIGRQQSDPQFAVAQQTLATLSPAVLAHFVATAPDPRPGMGRHRGVSARCSPLGSGALRNPWFCTVKYPAGPAVRYGVTVDPTGHMHGVNRDGSLVVFGCCVGFRPTQ